MCSPCEVSFFWFPSLRLKFLHWICQVHYSSLDFSTSDFSTSDFEPQNYEAQTLLFFFAFQVFSLRLWFFQAQNTSYTSNLQPLKIRHFQNSPFNPAINQIHHHFNKSHEVGCLSSTPSDNLNPFWLNIQIYSRIPSKKLQLLKNPPLLHTTKH